MLLILINCIQEGLHARSVERTSFPSQSALGHFTQWERLWTAGRPLSARHAAGQGTQQTLWALSFPFLWYTRTPP